MNTMRTVQISSQNMSIAPYWWVAVKLMLPDRVWAQVKLSVAHLYCYHCTGAYCWWSLCEPAQGAWMTLLQLVSSDKTVEKCGGWKLTELKELTKKCLCCIQLLYGRSKKHSASDCRGVPGTTVAFSGQEVTSVIINKSVINWRGIRGSTSVQSCCPMLNQTNLLYWIATSNAQPIRVHIEFMYSVSIVQQTHIQT